MKLIKKTNKNFLKLLLIVFPIASAMLYFSLNYFISEEIDEKLQVDELRITEHIKANHQFVSMDPVFEIRKLDHIKVPKLRIENVMVYDPLEKEDEPFRELESIKQINGAWYLIKVRHSTIESKDFMLAIGLTTGIILLLIFILLIYMNNKLSERLWSPFYRNIESLKTYTFANKDKLVLQATNIDEFNELNDSLSTLTYKLNKDYKTLKEFTENASHEIQTPLSIITMNLDEAMQLETKENVAKYMYTAYQSAQRLSNLNEKLLLLAKLDNKQFAELGTINLGELMLERIHDMEPMFNEKKLYPMTQTHGEFLVQMDVILANILLNNLLSNIIKYAVSGGEVKIEISSTALSMTNTCDGLVNESSIFERFSKGSQGPDSSGLGLSIVKKIIELARLNITAETTNNTFKIIIEKRA
jgi:hypothetical protein